MEKKNKILHITTYVNGGAGIAAYRIHEALLKANVDSVFLATDEPIIPNANSFISIIIPTKSIAKRVFDKFGRITARYFNVKLFNKYAYFQNKLNKIKPFLVGEPASLPFSKYKLCSHPAVLAADIIHLHWVAGLLDYSSFFANIKKPVVWTNHDMNSIKGLFHYEGDEMKNAGVAGKLDKEVNNYKAAALAKSKTKMAVVSPSNWLHKEIVKSERFTANKIFKIPNALNSNLFTIRETGKLRRELNIPVNHTVFLFVSQSIHNYRKGFDLLVNALDKLNSSNITLLMIGYAEHIELSNFNCINLGSIYEEEKLSYYYSLADAFIIPSREDNLPNVMLESLCCGTPVISFDLGGMAEVILNNVNGLKAKELNSDCLRDTLLKFIEIKEGFNRQTIREEALKLFSPEIIAQKYISVYKYLLK